MIEKLRIEDINEPQTRGDIGRYLENAESLESEILRIITSHDRVRDWFVQYFGRYPNRNGTSQLGEGFDIYLLPKKDCKTIAEAEHFLRELWLPNPFSPRSGPIPEVPIWHGIGPEEEGQPSEKEKRKKIEAVNNVIFRESGIKLPFIRYPVAFYSMEHGLGYPLGAGLNVYAFYNKKWFDEARKIR